MKIEKIKKEFDETFDIKDYCNNRTDSWETGNDLIWEWVESKLKEINTEVQKAREEAVRGFAKWYNLYVQQVEVNDSSDATLVSLMYIRKHAIEIYLQSLDKGDRE